MKQKKETLGVRNNNPLNIRSVSGTTWKGQTGSNKGFVVFDSMENGLRASFKIMLGYLGKGLITPRSIIARWAPECENDLKSYINFVVDNSSLLADKPIETDLELILLVKTMAIFESGYHCLAEDLLEGYKKACFCLGNKYQSRGYDYLTFNSFKDGNT